MSRNHFKSIAGMKYEHVNKFVLFFLSFSLSLSLLHTVCLCLSVSLYEMKRQNIYMNMYVEVKLYFDRPNNETAISKNTI